jgi:hypothetical protein
MKKPQVWHYHYDSSGHARKHLHFGGRVRHEHVNLTGYGQFTSTLHENEKDADRRRVKYFGRSTPSRIDAETAMNPKRYTLVATVRSKSRPGKMYEIKRDEDGNLSCNCPMWVFKKGGKRSCKHVQAMESIMANPGAARHRQEAVSLYKEARATDSERRKAVLQIRAAEHVQSAIESDAEGISNPSEHIDNRQTGVWDTRTLTEILRQLRRLVDKSGKKGLIVTRDNSKGIAEVKGARTGKLFLRAMQVHGGWIVRWDGKLIQRKGENKNPEIEVRCAFCGKTIRSIKTAKMYRGKIYHPECLKLLKKVQGVR